MFYTGEDRQMENFFVYEELANGTSILHAVITRDEELVILIPKKTGIKKIKRILSYLLEKEFEFILDTRGLFQILE